MRRLQVVNVAESGWRGLRTFALIAARNCGRSRGLSAVAALFPLNREVSMVAFAASVSYARLVFSGLGALGSSKAAR